MMANRATRPLAQRNVFAATLARFMDAHRSSHGRRPNARTKSPLFARLAVDRPVVIPDPVSVAVFAIDQVGPAAVRACASGVEVCVAAADEATAAVIRAALVETARRRPTDRLIRVVID
jgi:hypothetical protein